MNINQSRLKTLMIRDKLFLKDLYEGQDLEKKKKVLSFASDLKVIQNLYCSWMSKIPLHILLLSSQLLKSIKCSFAY
jgi:hypothetical protein